VTDQEVWDELFKGILKKPYKCSECGHWIQWTEHFCWGGGAG